MAYGMGIARDAARIALFAAKAAATAFLLVGGILLGMGAHALQGICVAAYRTSERLTDGSTRMVGGAALLWGGRPPEPSDFPVGAIWSRHLEAPQGFRRADEVASAG